MTATVKTAKDLPAGSQVAGRHGDWLMERPGNPWPWTRTSDSKHITHDTMDHLLADGAFITFIPSRPQQPMVAACHLCRDWHFNACPQLWGGQAEMVPAERRLPLGEVA